MTRAETSEGTFSEAATAANANGMRLTNPSDGCYQLRHNSKGWILNLYPRRKGFTPRVYRDRHHPGPWLDLSGHWTLLDAVNAAIAAEGNL